MEDSGHRLQGRLLHEPVQYAGCRSLPCKRLGVIDDLWKILAIACRADSYMSQFNALTVGACPASDLGVIDDLWKILAIACRAGSYMSPRLQDIDDYFLG